MNIVYFIQSGPHGPIKIGTTATLAKRLAHLQRGNPVPLEVMATISGGHELERQLHGLFARGALGGEWFDRETPGLIETVEHVLRYGSLPPEPEQAPDGERCSVCAWPTQLELVERGVTECWRCLTEKAAA